MFKIRKQKQSNEPTSKKSLRLWPGLVIVILQWLVRFGVPLFVPVDAAVQLGIFGAVICGILFIIWWVFYSRASWLERLGAPILMLAAIVVIPHFLDVSMATSMMGLLYVVYSIPVMCLAFVFWAIATRKHSTFLRRLTMVITILIASGFWTLLRTNGMTGDAQQDFVWRWSKTPEERLLSQQGHEKITPVKVQPVMLKGASWTGFRGPNRDGIVHDLQIKTNWANTPPVLMWRRPVGPACSSFAIMGDLFFTQEQLGDDELVSCYNLNNGTPIWKHSDKARFYDSHAGPGPRSTPTLQGNRVYTLGGSGILNVLDALTGSVIWTRNAATDTKIKVLQWGFTSSPLIVGDKVIVALSGKLAAYDTLTGKPLWYGPDSGNSYSSPHLVTIDGVQQVLLMSKSGVISLDPTSGKQLWTNSWPTMDKILQPALIEPADLLMASDASNGMRRIEVTHALDTWAVKNIWTSEQMLPDFNDFVIHKGYAYGFDGPSIACMDLKDGHKMWKGNRYRGWILLLADQDVLLVLSEKGELALVEANPKQFKELAHFPALKAKTWNHPALAGNVLLVRNSVEMIAFKLPVRGSN